MIPKKIHFVYISDKIPDKIQGYIDNWQRLLPDYEIIRWNRENFDVKSAKWVEQAVSAKKWAFAADYIRLYAVYNYGGIYLDSDVELLRPFGDELMKLPYFLGMEKTKAIIESAIFGAEQKMEWLKDILDFYADKEFILPNGNFNQITIPSIMLKIFKQKYGLSLIANPSKFNHDEKQIQILPPEFFSPKRCSDNYAIVTNNTRTIHHFDGSWTNAKNNFARTAKNKIADLIGESFYTNVMFKVFAKGKYRK